MNLTKTLKNPLLVVGVFVIVVVVIMLMTSTENHRLGQGLLIPLNQGWTVSSDAVNLEDETLPLKLDIPKGMSYEATYRFEQTYNQALSLRLRSSMQHMQVYLDDVLLFQSKTPKSSVFETPNVSVWYFVDLPPIASGQILRIVMHSRIQAFSGTINPVYLGEADALLYDLLYHKAFDLTLSLIILFFGLAMILLYGLVWRMRYEPALYLGLFTFLVSIWSLSEARLLQFIIGHQFLLGGISYMAVALVPIPFILYLKQTVYLKRKPFLNGLVLIYFFQFVVILLLQGFGISGFFQTISYTNITIVISAGILLYFLLDEAYRDYNQQAKQFIVQMGIIAAFMVLEVGNYFIGNFDWTGKFIRVGMVIFLAFTSKSVLNHVEKLVLVEKERQILEKLAFKDILTGGFNRAAFERDLEGLTQPYRLVIFDINNLKYVNDNFGHQFGDQMIVMAYSAIRDAFGEHNNVYRIGGDEFACIIKNTDLEVFEHAHKKLVHLCMNQTKALPYALNIAVGTDCYDAKRFDSCKSFIHHIDQLMYKNKKILKEDTVINP